MSDTLHNRPRATLVVGRSNPRARLLLRSSFDAVTLNTNSTAEAAAGDLVIVSKPPNRWLQ
jgi:hypothetical protein